TVLISGQVERLTEFEQGFPIHYAHSDAGWELDPMIWDDQNVIVNVSGKGLVIVSGCSHAGAVNVMRNAQRLTGVQRVAGFIGGFHLTGGIFEPIIGSTVDAFVAAKVGRVVPAHCTGWRAVHVLAQAMPEAFVQPAVGTVISVRADVARGCLGDGSQSRMRSATAGVQPPPRTVRTWASSAFDSARAAAASVLKPSSRNCSSRQRKTSSCASSRRSALLLSGARLAIQR